MQKNSKLSKPQLSSILPIDRTLRVLPLQARVNQGEMAVKEYSTFPKAPASSSDCSVFYLNTWTSPSDCLVSYQDTHWEGSYPPSAEG